MFTTNTKKLRRITFFLLFFIFLLMQAYAQQNLEDPSLDQIVSRCKTLSYGLDIKELEKRVNLEERTEFRVNVKNSISIMKKYLSKTDLNKEELINCYNDLSALLEKPMQYLAH